MFRQSAVALTIDGVPTEDEWLAAGKAILQTTRNQTWWLGDWWNFGSHEYGQRSKALRDAELSAKFQTFANAGRVSRKFETSRRREDLSWHHHSLVAALPVEDQERYLDLATREGLSGTAMLDVIKSDELHRSADEPMSEKPLSRTPKRPSTNTKPASIRKPVSHPPATWPRECLETILQTILEACESLTAHVNCEKHPEFIEYARQVTIACALLIDAALGDDPKPERIHELCAVVQCEWSVNECVRRQRVGISRIKIGDVTFDFAGRHTSGKKMKAQDARSDGSIERAY